MHKITLTKFDAIRAQLDAAIEMYFLSDNVIATHTLAAAAYNALKDIAKQQQAPHPFLKTEYVHSLSDTEQKRIMKLLNAPENFFKHADRDPHTTIDFDCELTELLLIDAIAYFKYSEELRPKYYDIFKVWVGEIRKETLPDENLRSLAENFRDSLKVHGKAEFWRYMVEILAMRSSISRDASNDVSA